MIVSGPDVGFVEKFWEWFDSLPKPEKERFWYYKDDMAEIYFYNKFWNRMHSLEGI